MTDKDPEKTDTNWQKYLRADGWLDRHLAALVASPLTLAVFITLAVGLVAFGFWAAW
jgi:hypothetical protein